MQTIKTYLYSNTIEVQFLDPTIFTVRNNIVYSRTIKIYQGIDNPLQVVVKNQDQKPIDTTNYLVQLSIQDPAIKGSVQTIPVTMVTPTKGQGIVTISRDIVNALDQRIYKINIKLITISTNAERPLYIDDNYGAMLDLEVLPGWYESMPLTMDSDEVIDAGTI
jgi:hypothetical protein